jgi:hypothetical protein
MGTAQDWQGPGPINGSRYLMCLRSDSLRYVIERLALPGMLLIKTNLKCEYCRMLCFFIWFLSWFENGEKFLVIISTVQ